MKFGQKIPFDRGDNSTFIKAIQEIKNKKKEYLIKLFGIN